MSRFRKISLALAFSLAVLMGQAAHAGPLPFSETWLEGLRGDARRSGVSEKTIQDRLFNLTPMDKFPSREEQKEFSKKVTLADYLRPRVTPENIADGSSFMRQHGAFLRDLEREHGVPPQVVMAIWAIETQFGRNTGDLDVVTSLVTLARDHPDEEKRDSFRREAIAALKLIDAGYRIEKGSWAGAMGQPQFMPSNVEKLGVDLNGDGMKDIWNDKDEIFASIANYLARSRLGGWQRGQRWGREVVLPSGFNKGLLTDNLKHQVQKTPDEWRRLGVTLPEGSPLPSENSMKGMLIAPDGANGRIFLVYNNFKTVMGYNPAYKYSLAVHILADAIAEKYVISQPSPGLN